MRIRRLHAVLMAASVLTFAASCIHAQTYGATPPLSPTAQYDIDRNQAMARYKQDQKLCDESLDSSTRMQCRRDAKAEYDNAIAAARANMNAAMSAPPLPAPVYQPPPVVYQPAPAQPAPVLASPVRSASVEPPLSSAGTAPPPPTQYACYDCGQVTNVFQAEKKGQGSGLGVVMGAIAGGVLGHQVGGGMGKNLATIAGAAGGAFAGNAIESNAKSSKSWTVTVAYPNSTTVNYEFANAPMFKVGDLVRSSGQTIVYP